jgi:hypothetical protein
MNRPNNVDKSQKDYEFARNWDMRLSPKEITEMERLSATANALQLSSNDYKNPLNMSLRDLFKEWSKQTLNTIMDIISFMVNIGNYQKYFSDIDDSNQWFTGIITILRDFFKIFRKEQRSLYVGFTILIISIMLWYINVIENK